MTAISMSSVKFDAIEYIRKLRNANFTQEQAETIAQETEHIMDAVIQQSKHASKELFNNKDLSTKGDLERVKLELQKKIE